MYPANDQDRANLKFAKDFLEKAKKKGVAKVPQLADWVGSVGFNACVARLSKEKGIESAKAVCGALKGEARKRGTLSKEHMGRKEKAKAKGKKK